MELRNLNKTIIPSHKDTTPISRGANSIEPPQALQKNFKITTNKLAKLDILIITIYKILIERIITQ